MTSQFFNEKLSAEVLSKLSSFRESGIFCDVTLEADSSWKTISEATLRTTIRAHKLVLAAASPYFRETLSTGGFVESKEIRVVVKDIDDETLRLLVDYFYTGRLDIKEKNVKALFGVAKNLHLDSVLNECTRYLKEHLSISNCMETAAFAKAHNCIELDDAAVSFTRQHFRELVKSEELLSMDETTFLHFISDDHAVFEAVINWVKHDLSRQASLPNVLVGVRLPLTTPEFLLDRVYNEPMIQKSSACMVMLGKIFHGMLSKNKTLDIPESWYRHRQTPLSKTIMVAGGRSDDFSYLTNVNIYDPYNKQWTVAAPLHQPRRSFGMATADESIYAVGGASTNDVLRSVEIYDSHRNSWRAGPKMLCCRYGPGVTALNGAIFAAGGNIGTKTGRKAELLDPRQGKWISLPSMTSGRSHFGLAAVNGLLYAAGGDSRSPTLNSVEVYDPRACRWTTAQPMLKRRCHAGVTVFRDQVVVVGGSDEKYTMLTDNGWTFLPEMSLPKEGLGVVNVDGSLFTFGGTNNDGYLSCIEYLDFDSNQWKMSQVGMPQKNAYFGVTFLP
ncbi:hypothetical protein Q1695_011350 [Nippostrongylus brasiliensis]|nr:hypothetical protein Q1695_011350 [Nippostrongylus brasiliensis]